MIVQTARVYPGCDFRQQRALGSVASCCRASISAALCARVVAAARPSAITDGGGCGTATCDYRGWALVVTRHQATLAAMSKDVFPIPIPSLPTLVPPRYARGGLCEFNMCSRTGAWGREGWHLAVCSGTSHLRCSSVTCCNSRRHIPRALSFCTAALSSLFSQYSSHFLFSFFFSICIFSAQCSLHLLSFTFPP